jgi:hypothetical protein
MAISRKFFHDRTILLLLTTLTTLLGIGVALILLKFDAGKSPLTVVAFRPNIVGSNYVSGGPIDIYSLALFMVLVAGGAALLSEHVYEVRRYLSIFILSSSVLLLILSVIVSNSLIALH